MYEYIESIGILFQLAGSIWGIIVVTKLHSKIKRIQEEIGGLPWEGPNGLDAIILSITKPAIGSLCALVFGTLLLLINSLPHGGLS